MYLYKQMSGRVPSLLSSVSLLVQPIGQGWTGVAGGRGRVVIFMLETRLSELSNILLLPTQHTFMVSKSRPNFFSNAQTISVFFSFFDQFPILFCVCAKEKEEITVFGREKERQLKLGDGFYFFFPFLFCNFCEFWVTDQSTDFFLTKKGEKGTKKD